jgi:hypothetical protein
MDISSSQCIWRILNRYASLQFGVIIINVIQESLKGVWMIDEPSLKPDIVFYFAHGRCLT